MTDSSRTTDISKAPARATATPERAQPASAGTQPLALHLQRAIGNDAVQRLGAGLRMGVAGDAQEQAAEHAGERIAEAIPSSAPASDGEPRDGGAPISPTVRRAAEATLGPSVAGTRVHSGAPASQSADAIGARAYTVGRDIVFNHGQLTTSSLEGRRLLGHELAHVAQQAADGPMVQRQPKSGTDTPPPPPPVTGIPVIPAEAVLEPKHDDVLVAVSPDKRMVALPAQGAMVTLVQFPEGKAPSTALFTLPTIGKEVLMVVNVGGRTGFALDMGGKTSVVFPEAMRAIQSALGVTKVPSGMLTHIHLDHVRSLTQMVRTQGITPGNLHVPAAFLDSPAGKAGKLGTFLKALENDPTMRPLGYGQGTAYARIETPATATFFRNTVSSGDTDFEYVGLTRAFKDIEAAKTKDALDKTADAGSLLVKVTHRPSKTQTLYTSDLRGDNLTKIREAMGETAYREFLSGVTTIVNLQHHIGALETPGERAGLVELLVNTYLRTGALTVVAQTYELGPKGQFLNRSLIEALRQAGIDIHVALEPGAGGKVGTVTSWTGGDVTKKGEGQTETFFGEQEAHAQVKRLLELRVAEEALTKYERFLPEAERQSGAVRAAREAHEKNLEEFLTVLIANVQGGAAGRAQGTLADPAAVQQALAKVRSTKPVEAELLPARMKELRETLAHGPHLEILERELPKARISGRLSDEGIDALWEVNPELAEKLIRTSGMSPRAQRETMAAVPSLGVPPRTRFAAGGFLALQLLMEAMPVIEQVEARANDDNVGRQLADIMWWQGKGVFPKLHAVNDRWGWWRNQETRDDKEIQAWLNAGKIDYLAMTDIREESWDLFMVWATTTLQTARDWWNLIGVRHDKTIRRVSAGTSYKWQWRRTTIDEGRLGFDIDEEWVDSDRLTTILEAAWDHMYQTTSAEIEKVGTAPGPKTEKAFTRPGAYLQQDLFADKPQALGKRRFKASVEEPELYTLAGQHSRSIEKDSLFWLFPNSGAYGKVPGGYVVVGGANYSTYVRIFYRRNFVEIRGEEMMVEPNTFEVLLAKEADLEPAP